MNIDLSMVTVISDPLHYKHQLVSTSRNFFSTGKNRFHYQTGENERGLQLEFDENNLFRTSEIEHGLQFEFEELIHSFLARSNAVSRTNSFPRCEIERGFPLKTQRTIAFARREIE